MLVPASPLMWCLMTACISTFIMCTLAVQVSSADQPEEPAPVEHRAFDSSLPMKQRWEAASDTFADLEQGRLPPVESLSFLRGLNHRMVDREKAALLDAELQAVVLRQCTRQFRKTSDDKMRMELLLLIGFLANAGDENAREWTARLQSTDPTLESPFTSTSALIARAAGGSAEAVAEAVGILKGNSGRQL